MCGGFGLQCRKAGRQPGAVHDALAGMAGGNEARPHSGFYGTTQRGAFAGETVVLTATFDALDGPALRCAVEARVGPRLVATGHTGQRIVNRARLAARFAALQAEAAAQSEPNHEHGQRR